MKKQVDFAVIGLGGRGAGLLDVLLRMEDVNITAVCDLYQDRVENAAKKVKKAKGNTPFCTLDYREIFEKCTVDGVLIATNWEYHVEIAVYAMEHGVFTAMEVGGTYHLEDCWRLVDTYERTGTPLMFLENCCYGQRELMCLNMARAGIFGEIVHCDGAYKHDLRDEVAFGRENRHYRLKHYQEHNCDNYPTHDLGPIAKILDINRGNRMVSLVSVASKSRGLCEFIRIDKKADKSLLEKGFNQGDIVTTLITCENGETIRLTLDTTLPRIYSRDFCVHGTKGMYQEDGDYVFLDNKAKVAALQLDGKPWRIWRNARKYARKYDSPLWRHKSTGMRKSGHGGMDYLVLRAMVASAKGETLPPIDVYDAAAWMCVTALSEKSVAESGAPQEIPDFTRGKYRSRTDSAQGKYALPSGVVQAAD